MQIELFSSVKAGKLHTDETIFQNVHIRSLQEVPIWLIYQGKTEN